MRIKFSKLFGCVALVAASLCLAGHAAADTLNGAVWTGLIGSYPPLPTTIPLPAGYSSSTTPDAAVPGSTNPNIAFTLSNPGASYMFGMFSNTDGDLTDFLTNSGTNGNVVNYTQGGDQGSSATNCPTLTTSACGINNDVMEFWGSTYLVNGQSYSFTYDDAMLLNIDGVPFIDAQNPEYEDSVTATWTGLTGTHNFNAWYDELNGAPAELDSPDFAVTPEPSSLLLLGTGLFGLAFLLFRRSIKPAATLNA